MGVLKHQNELVYSIPLSRNIVIMVDDITFKDRGDRRVTHFDVDDVVTV